MDMSVKGVAYQAHYHQSQSYVLTTGMISLRAIYYALCVILIAGNDIKQHYSLLSSLIKKWGSKISPIAFKIVALPLLCLIISCIGKNSL